MKKYKLLELFKKSIYSSLLYPTILKLMTRMSSQCNSNYGNFIIICIYLFFSATAGLVSTIQLKVTFNISSVNQVPLSTSLQNDVMFPTLLLQTKTTYLSQMLSWFFLTGMAADTSARNLFFFIPDGHWVKRSTQGPASRIPRWDRRDNHAWTRFRS